MTEKDLKKSLTQVIQRIQDIRDCITAKNAKFFDITINEKRDLKPVRSSKKITGFKQASALVFSVTVKDYTLEGKIL